MRSRSCGIALVLALGLASSAAAQTAHVPSQYSTIQAAIDAGATTVYVSGDVYPEILDVQHDLTLLPDPPADARQPYPYPRINGLNIVHNGATPAVVYVRGFRIATQVNQTNAAMNPGITTLEGCRLDGGFNTGMSNPLGETIRIRNCVVQGNVFVYAYYTDVSGNMVMGGTLTVHSNGGSGAIIRDNFVYGSPATGIVCPSGDSPGTITGNKVHGAVTGYKVTTAAMRSNVAEDCSGTGFTCSDPSWTSISSQNDIARRCGGYGFDFNATHGTVNMLASIADTIAGVGMHVASGLSTPTFIYSGTQQTGSHGIWFENGGMVKGCGAVRAGGYGILNTLGRVDSNVVGRCALTGIRAREARQNTSYLNLGSGFQILGPVPDTISLNIAYGNSHYGMEWLGSGTPVRKCNDWYANTLGATSGTTPGLTDLAVDPKFCNLPNDDVRLSATSPLLAVVGCGRIGPRGQGCSVPTGVVNDAASEDGAMTIRPNPSPGGIEIAFARSATASRVEVYDLAGARRFSAVVDAGATRFHWSGQDERGLPVPAGVYFVRHETGGRQQTARVVLAR